MKKFNKLKFLSRLGFVDRRFNNETGRFEQSPVDVLKSYLALFLRVTFGLRVIFSVFFDREDSIQLIIGEYLWNHRTIQFESLNCWSLPGNCYNHVRPDTAKNFLALAVSQSKLKNLKICFFVVY